MRAPDSVHNLRHPHIHRDAGNGEGFSVMEAIKLHQELHHVVQRHIGSIGQIFGISKSDPVSYTHLVNSRLDAVYFGAYDPKAGALGSLCDLNAIGLNHRFAVEGGVLESECAQILKEYFAGKRKKRR